MPSPVTVAPVQAALATAGGLGDRLTGLSPLLSIAVVLTVTGMCAYRLAHRRERAAFPKLPVATRRTGAWTLGVASALVAVAALAIYRGWAISQFPFTPVTLFFTVTATISAALFVLAARGSGADPDGDVPDGKVVAVVPAYNEAPAALEACVWALLASTRPPDAIHVVDDGSTIPVRGFGHPKVMWHRQDNAGKRAAQTSVLRHYRPGDVDFIVTVDSDSVVAPGAIAAALSAMGADASVQAVTSLVTVRRLTNLWSRLLDLEIVTGIFLVRRARAALGAVTPTSGALSVYRAAPVLENLHDYVTSGTFSDDRRLAHYCLLRGRVIALNEVLVATDMPATLRGIWRQRVRWYKGYWKYLPWEDAHLGGAAWWLRLYNTVLAAVFPLGLAWVCLVMPLTGRGFFWPPFVLWLAVLYAQNLTYAARPGLSATTRWLTWAFATPLLIPYQLLVIRPAMYWALLTARSERWDGHRIDYHPAPAT